MRLEHFIILHTKIKLIKDLNVRLEIIQLLGENIGRIFNINCNNIFLDLSPKCKRNKSENK